MKRKKGFKKTISGIIAAAMIVPTICQAGVFAAADSGLESAILKVKSVIEIPSELSEFNSEKYSVGNGVEYILNWNSKNSDDNSYYDDYKNIEVRVNKQNDIEYYRKSSSKRNDDKKLAKFSDDKYKEFAQNWINKIVPNLAGEYEFDDIYNHIGSSDIRISFKRMKNGVEYCNNRINVNIDKESGEVTNYSLYHLYVNDAPNPADAIDETAKRDGFMKQSGLDKFYMTKSNSKEAIIVYSPKNPYISMDSTTGEIPQLTDAEKKKQDENKNFYDMENAAPAEASNASGGGGSRVTGAAADSASAKQSLSESELSNVESYSNLIEPKDAEKLIRSIENTFIDECELSSYRYYKRSEFAEPLPITAASAADESTGAKSKEEYYAEFSFEKEEDGDKHSYVSANVVINAETGELVSLSSYNYGNFIDSSFDYDDTKGGHVVSKEVREQNAIDFINKYAEKQAGKVKNFNKDAKDAEDPISFIFNESVNDIKYENNYMKISVDKTTGKIKSFYKVWTDGISFEPADNIISEDDAANILFDKVGFKEYYSDIARSEYAPAIRLVYQLGGSSPYYISASSGKFINYDGTERTNIDKIVNEFTDIDDYFAKDIILELVRNGVITVGEDGKFRPNDAISYKEVSELMESLNYDWDFYYRRSDDNDNLKALVNKTELTRLEAITCIIESMGYGKAARLEGIYNCSFTDAEKIDESKLGYAAIAKALGIVNGDENGCFNPDDIVTRGEFAIMLYNLAS